MRILVAGIGSMLLGDDSFGVEVVRRLSNRPQPNGVSVIDFGIRSFDLAYAIPDDYDATILVDTLSRGAAPGTLHVIEPELDPDPVEVEIDAQTLDPVKVLQLVRLLGGRPHDIVVVGCEPETYSPEDEGQRGLGEAVQAALDEAVQTIEGLIDQWRVARPLAIATSKRT